MGSRSPGLMAPNRCNIDSPDTQEQQRTFDNGSAGECSQCRGVEERGTVTIFMVLLIFLARQMEGRKSKDEEESTGA